MNPDLLDDEVFACIAKNMGLDVGENESREAISKLTAKEAFQRWCWWNGFMGNWSEHMVAAYENIKEAAE